MQRRDALRLLAAFPGLLAACAQGRTMPSDRPQSASAPSPRMPSIFLGHGAPPLLDDPQWMAELARWAHALPRPRAILVVSAHWQARPATLGATRPVPLVYDFYGFPQRFYELTYPSPGAQELATRVRALLSGKGIAVAEPSDRGLDHGVYVPLMAMYPEADVQVLQLSLPGLDAATLLALGGALAPLRDEGVLILGSGFMTHNLRALGTPGIAPWAREFDAWATETLARKDVDALLDWEARAPAARTAHPTTEHFVPLIVAVGAAAGSAHSVRFPITGFWMDKSFSKRSVELG